MSATTETGPRVETKRRFGTGARVGAAVGSVLLGFLFASVMIGPDPCLPMTCDFHPRLGLFAGGSLSIAQDFVLLLSFLVGGAFAATAMPERVRSQALAGAAVIAVTLLALVVGSSAATGTWYEADGTALTSEHFPGPFDLAVFKGPSHCDWGSVVFFETAWPIGGGPHAGPPREYVRDPKDQFSAQDLQATFEPGVALPSDARDTGLHRANWHLWISDSQVDRRIFMVNGSLAEAWPREREILGCA